MKASGRASEGLYLRGGVGALTAPNGSVATMIAFDRAGRIGEELGSVSVLKLWTPFAFLATGAATASLWLITRA